MKLSKIIAVTAILLAGTPALAHHSFAAEYDAQKPITISGIVTKVDWINPHAYIYIETKDEAGKVSNFKIEMGPPYALTRGGWKRESVKIGDRITVEGAASAKDGSNAAGSTQATTMILANGEKLVMR